MRDKAIAILLLLVGVVSGPFVALSQTGCRPCNPAPGEVCPAICVTELYPARVVVGAIVLISLTILAVWLWRRSSPLLTDPPVPPST